MNTPHTLATLYAFQHFLGLPAPNDEARQWAALNAATAWMESATRRRLLPRLARLPHSIPPSDPAELILSADLLELRALIDAEGQPVPLDEVVAICEGVLHHLGGAFPGGPRARLEVEGWWGWHDQPALCWATRDALQSTLSAEAASAAVQSVSATEADGLPRFQAGHLLRLGDELAWVLATDPASHTLHLARGSGGTTAQAHPQGAPVAVYVPPAELSAVCLRLAAWLYQQPEAEAEPPTPAELGRYLRLRL